MSIKVADTGQKVLLLNSLMDISSNVNELGLGDSDDGRFLDSFIITIGDLIYYINNAKSIPVHKDIAYDGRVVVVDLLKEVTDLKFLLEDKKKEIRDLSFFRTKLKEHQDNIELYLSSLVTRPEHLNTSLEHHRLMILSRELKNVVELSQKKIKKIDAERLEQKDRINLLNEKIVINKNELRTLADASKLMNEQLKKDSEALKESKVKLEKRAAYLDELMGKEVGKSLFLTFDKRKKELNITVFIWVVLVLVTSGGAFYFTEQLFANKDFSTIRWTEYAANTIKLVPLFIVLFFCIRQYQRERNFQEEYAFKSAVALTINAYSEQVKDKDKRDDMIIESVSKVYDSPITKHLSKEAIKNKSMLKGIEVMKDTVAGVTKDTVDIVKAVKK